MDRQQLNILHILARRWMGSHTYVNSGNMLIMLHVGGIGGFLASCTSHLWGRRLPWTNECNKFQDVGAKEVTSNFPPQPVLDNSPYQCLLVDRPLLTTTAKTGMIWLCWKGIVSDETMSKNDWLVNSSTEAQRDISNIDRICGHAVWLPLRVT